MKFLPSIASVLALLVAAASSQAASLKCRGDTAYISGEFKLEDINRFPFSLQCPAGLRTVSLDSGGGNLAVSILTAKVIAGNKLHTVVERGRTCASACFFLLLAGKDPVVHIRSRIGVHSASQSREFTKPITIPGSS